MRAKHDNHTRCEIALLVDEETGARRRAGHFVPDRHSVEAYVLDVLRAHYRGVEVVPFHPDVTATAAELRRLAPELVFNLTEWVDGDRSLDAAIAGLLDLMRIKYTGTGPDGMRLARDKALSKAIVAGLGVDVPRHFIIGGSGRIRNPGLPYPLIVKPQFGDASEEIRANSVVRSDAALAKRVRAMRRRVDGPLICEQFVAGDDLYVALLGNRPDVMPPVRLTIGRKARAAPQTATWRLKNDGAYRGKWRVRWRPARLAEKLMREVKAASRAIFHALKLRDYARIDFRLTPQGRIVFLEANPNPDLHPHAMGINLCFAGVDHRDAVRRIVEAARRR
jgi:D-alanine-D-alanine ligase